VGSDMVSTDSSTHVYRFANRWTIHDRRQASLDSIHDVRSGVWEFVQCSSDVSARVVWNGSVLRIMIIMNRADGVVAHFSQVCFVVYFKWKRY
jgi:hypothetical protein